MRKPTVTCALVAAMVAKHRWGTPIDEDSLLAIAAVQDREYPAARRAFEALQERPFIRAVGNRGIELEPSRFDALAEFLYEECGWEPFQIRSRLKHYEGWDNHEWA